MREHPNTTAFRLQDEIVTNALFTQRIAPIMNEFDTMPEQKLAMLVEEDLQNIAALPAALFSGKIMIPIRQSWSENQREQVLRKAGVETCLTAHRMQYYFRMTYEDALDKLTTASMRNKSLHRLPSYTILTKTEILLKKKSSSKTFLPVSL